MMMDFVIKTVQQTGIVIGIMACVTGVTLGVIGVAERFLRGK